MLSMPNVRHSRSGKFDLSQARQKRLACNPRTEEKYLSFLR